MDGHPPLTWRRWYAIGALGHGGDDLENLVKKVEGDGRDDILTNADISDEVQMRSAVATLFYGRLDVVVANAGINGVWAPIDDLSLEEWNKTI